MSNSRRSRLARCTRNSIAVYAQKMDAQWRASYVGGQPDMSPHAWNNHVQHHAAQAWKFHTGRTKPADILIERSNNLVKVVEALLSHTHDDADYCPSCGQNYHSTIGKTCCDECGSTCNLQDGCGSNDCTNIPTGCEAGNHEYSTSKCPSCGYEFCYSCPEVRITDESQATGSFYCKCGFEGNYPLTEGWFEYDEQEKVLHSCGESGETNSWAPTPSDGTVKFYASKGLELYEKEGEEYLFVRQK